MTLRAINDTTRRAKLLSAEFKYDKDHFHYVFYFGCTGYEFMEAIDGLSSLIFKSLKEGHGRLFIGPEAYHLGDMLLIQPIRVCLLRTRSEILHYYTLNSLSLF